jgi:DNA-binding PadR family transcriptional regulator
MRRSFFGGRHRHDHFGGSGIRAAKMFASGDLQLIILALLSEKPRHGYEVIKALEEHSNGVYAPSPGMVYPALTYLEEVGYATSEADGNKKLFRITEQGSEYLAKNRSIADDAMESLARYGQKMAKISKHLADEEAEEERWGGGSGEQTKKEWRQMKMEFHDLKHELKAAIFEKIHASMDEKKRVLAVLKRAISEIRNG